MRIIVYKLFILFWILIHPFHHLYSQDDDCYSVLERAEMLYEEGMIEEIPSLLQGCIEKGFTREQKLRAYKLIIFAYLYDENQVEAQKAMLEFLKKYPEYEPRRSDSPEFIYLFEQYKTSIIYSVGILAGFNFSYPIVNEPYSVGNLNRTSGQRHRMRGSNHFGVQINRYITEEIEISTELLSARYRFEFSEDIVNRFEPVFVEKQSRLDIPITGTYQFDYKYFNPFVRAGIGFGIIQSSNATVSRNYVNGERDNIKEQQININSHRNKFQMYGVVGAGARYKVPRGYAVFDVRYNFGFSEMMNPEERYTHPLLQNLFYYTEDDFRVNNLTFSVGYVLLLYRPSNKKK